MAFLRKTLYLGAAVWAFSGLSLAVAPHFWLVTVFDQRTYPDYGYVRIAGTLAFALALGMVLVAHRISEVWWWSWAFVVAAAVVALIAVVNAAVGVPDGSPTVLWWIIGGVNGAFTAALVYGLGRTGMERSPV